MTEEEARHWLRTTFAVSRETWGKIEAYIALLFEGMARQNLIAESTRDQVWARHIVDSAQLLPLADGHGPGSWVDLGSGAGLPGIVVALLSERPVFLVEARRKRVEFLCDVVEALGLGNATVLLGRSETLTLGSPAAVVSARAFAPLPRLFATSAHLADLNTLWLLPKGRHWENELESASPTWQAVFHVEQSVTDPESAILVARSVRKRGRR